MNNEATQNMTPGQDPTADQPEPWADIHMRSVGWSAPDSPAILPAVGRGPNPPLPPFVYLGEDSF